MPTRPPEQRIQSTIFPEAPAENSPGSPPAAEPTRLPDGVTLHLKGKQVDYAILATVPDPENRTVIVSASPSTPFQDVSAVLEKIHDMGFLVAFKSQE